MKIIEYKEGKIIRYTIMFEKNIGFYHIFGCPSDEYIYTSYKKKFKTLEECEEDLIKNHKTNNLERRVINIVKNTNKNLFCLLTQKQIEDMVKEFNEAQKKFRLTLKKIQ